MKTIFSLILSAFAFHASAQNGYLKLTNDSTFTGYLKYYASVSDGRPGIEFWRTKNDKSPRRIPKQQISEYAIRKDTFKVLHKFKPFHDGDTYFEIADAKLKSSGKINLYIVDNSQNRVSTYTGGGLIPAIIDESSGNHPFLYLLEDNRSGYIGALSSKKDKLREALRDFFPDAYLTKYAEVKGEIKYKSVPDLVKLYNSR